MALNFGRRADAPLPSLAHPEVVRRRVLRVDSQSELARLPQPLRRVLRDDFDVGASSNRFCPMQYEDGSVVIATLEAYQDSDQVDELERMVVRRRYRLAEPSRLVVPATLLLALVRSQVGSGGPGLPRTPGSASAMADAFHDMVAWGLQHDASDLHVNLRMHAAESEVRYTVAGRYVAPARFARMPTVTLMEILSVAWMDVQGGNGAVFDPLIEQQGRIALEIGGRPVMLRWASLAADSGASVCLRILRLDARVEASFAALGYLPEQIATLDRARLTDGGAIVVAGVVGSGKSTTIAAMMSMIPSTRKVITLEDPVEYLIPGALQNSVVRTLDAERQDAFDAKLRTVKRSAMHDLLVGEVRDTQTGRAFMDLAGSGISLYTTVHAGAAMLIPDRLASDFIGVSRDFLATPGILKLLVYQALLPKLCSHCAEPLSAWSAADPDRWGAYRDRIESACGCSSTSVRMRSVAGCAHCRARRMPELYGLDGRTVVAEMIEPAADDVFLANLRRADNVRQRRHLASQRSAPYNAPGMRGKTAMECGLYKCLQGELDPRDLQARFGAFAADGCAP
ncbi:general secretion pathway protein [Verticiella sediminum]|uniref:General secretion pathway protein n=1 Tax=Verticiella sediminum TaxID=1247510 RepID=A0A556AVV3_9BURK|nr:ATPase, T2SS/T4P/T4SS family [Verticiella sediminum]TSH97071.1 general secretion pathway protein [Verticiella sediminum]